MKHEGSAGEVLRVFLGLGLTSFGGPVAHLGYFRREFVEKRFWLTETEYSSLVALCQFLPGPASSQVGFSIGMRRAGFFGGLAAWVGFTLPSALLMALAAKYMLVFGANPLVRGVLHGLQLAAVAVVAQAVWSMARNLCPDAPRAILAVLATAILMMLPGTAGQILVLVLGGVLGRLTLETPALPPGPAPEVAHRAAFYAFGAFLVLLALSFEVPDGGKLALAAAFYQSGALVFGGGHVVLPLLHDTVVAPGWVPQGIFLAGYGAAQAVPGPLFTVAAFLGWLATTGPGGWQGAAIATAAIFLPGLLIVSGTLPYWRGLQYRAGIVTTLMGVNAAVVGLLFSALISLCDMSLHVTVWDLPVALAALLLLTLGRVRPVVVVACCAVAGVMV